MSHLCLQPAPRPAHIPALDGVRGLAILLVLLTHGCEMALTPHTAFEQGLANVANWGWIGVDLFFVLSGFLITGILLAGRGQKHSLRNFFARRALRILPLYYATILICLVLLPLVATSARYDWLRDLAGQQAWFWFHLSNYYKILGNDPPMHWLSCLWSLAVEEHFYLVWPFLVRMIAPRRLLPLCMLLLVAGLGLRIALALAGLGGDYLYRSTLTRADPLLLGAVLAILFHERDLARHARRARWVVILALGTLLAQMATHAGADGRRTTFYGMTGQYTTVALLFGGVLTLILTAPRASRGQRLFTWSPLLALGKHSYALYILNKPTFLLVREWFLPSDWLLAGSQVPAALAFILVGGVLAFLGAQITWHVLEKPCLGLKRHFDSRSVATVASERQLPASRVAA